MSLFLSTSPVGSRNKSHGDDDYANGDATALRAFPRASSPRQGSQDAQASRGSQNSPRGGQVEMDPLEADASSGTSDAIMIGGTRVQHLQQQQQQQHGVAHGPQGASHNSAKTTDAGQRRASVSSASGRRKSRSATHKSHEHRIVHIEAPRVSRSDSRTRKKRSAAPLFGVPENQGGGSGRSSKQSGTHSTRPKSDVRKGSDDTDDSMSRPAYLRGLIEKEHYASQQVEESQSLMCGPQNMMLGVLLVLLLVAGVLLVYVASEQREQERIEQAEQEFKSSMAGYGRALTKFLALIASDLSVWSTYLQHTRSAVTYRQLYDNMDTSTPTLLWTQHVLAHEREAVEEEIYDEMSAYYNTTSLSRNTTQVIIDSEGNVAGVQVSVPKPEYFIIRYVQPETLSGLTMRDVNSDPIRERVFNTSHQLRSLTITPRVFVSSPLGVRLTMIATVPVYQFQNESNLLGNLVSGVLWTQLVPEAVASESPQAASVLLRVFDITNDELDQTGCTFSTLFRGVHDRHTGEWMQSTVDELFATPCYSSRAEIEALAGDVSVFQELTLGNRKFLAIMETSGDLEADVTVNQLLIITAAILGVLAMALIVGVGWRGWRLIHELTVARQNVLKEAVHTASAEFETRKALEQRDEFIAFMSHELRTPLFSILGAIDELNDRIRGESRELIDGVEDAGHKMVATLNSVLSVQNVARGTVEVQQHPLNFDALVKSACSDEAVNAEAKDIQIEYKWDERLPRIVYGDAHMLSAIVQHLVSNAVQYTQPGGDVCVSVRRECKGRSMDLKVMRMSQERSNFKRVKRSVVFLSELDNDDDDDAEDGITLRLTVTDTGIGIDRKRLSTIFEPFSCERLASSSRKHGHTELGLPTVKTLTTRLGGIVDVTSTLGEGSQFSVVLYLPTEAPSSAATSPKMGVRGGRKEQLGQAPKLDVTRELIQRKLAGRTVIICEDDDMNRFIIRQMLGAELPDTAVVEACDGVEGLAEYEKLKEAGQLPVAIFSDILMPSMSGTEFASMLRGRRFRGPVFAVTGGSLSTERRSYLAAGFTDVLNKPFRRQDITAMLMKNWDLVRAS